MAIVVNGVTLPNLPDGVFDAHPCGVIVQTASADGTTEYQLAAAVSKIVAIPAELSQLTYDMVGCLDNGYTVYTAAPDATEWTAQGEVADSSYINYVGTVDDIVYTPLWANHDILTVTGEDENGNPAFGDVYFASSEIEKEKRYSAYESWWKRLANFTRNVAGIKIALNHEDILEWLGKVSFIPQGYASSKISGMKLNSAANGELPVVYEGAASSTICAMKLSSSAIAALEE